jgi:hypothetical protein
MQTTGRGVAVLVLALLASIACGDDDDDDDDGGGASAALSHEGVDGSDERAKAVFDAYCDNAVRCEKTSGQTKDQCYSDLDIGWFTFSAQRSERCRDANLDSKGCYAQVSCATYETACDALEQAYFDCN